MTHTIRATVIVLIASAALATTTVTEEKANSVVGAWKHVEQKNGDATEYTKLPDGTVMYDCIVGGRFIWTVVQNGKAVGVAGGTGARTPVSSAHGGGMGICLSRRDLKPLLCRR